MQFYNSRVDENVYSFVPKEFHHLLDRWGSERWISILNILTLLGDPYDKMSDPCHLVSVFGLRGVGKTSITCDVVESLNAPYVWIPCKLHSGLVDSSSLRPKMDIVVYILNKLKSQLQRHAYVATYKHHTRRVNLSNKITSSPRGTLFESFSNDITSDSIEMLMSKVKKEIEDALECDYSLTHKLDDDVCHLLSAYEGVLDNHQSYEEAPLTAYLILDDVSYLTESLRDILDSLLTVHNRMLMRSEIYIWGQMRFCILCLDMQPVRCGRLEQCRLEMQLPNCTGQELPFTVYFPIYSLGEIKSILQSGFTSLAIPALLIELPRHSLEVHQFTDQGSDNGQHTDTDNNDCGAKSEISPMQFVFILPSTKGDTPTPQRITIPFDDLLAVWTEFLESILNEIYTFYKSDNNDLKAIVRLLWCLYITHYIYRGMHTNQTWLSSVMRNHTYTILRYRNMRVLCDELNTLWLNMSRQSAESCVQDRVSPSPNIPGSLTDWHRNANAYFNSKFTSSGRSRIRGRVGGGEKSKIAETPFINNANYSCDKSVYSKFLLVSAYLSSLTCLYGDDKKIFKSVNRCQSNLMCNIPSYEDESHHGREVNKCKSGGRGRGSENVDRATLTPRTMPRRRKNNKSSEIVSNRSGPFTLQTLTALCDALYIYKREEPITINADFYEAINKLVKSGMLSVMYSAKELRSVRLKPSKLLKHFESISVDEIDQCFSCQSLPPYVDREFIFNVSESTALEIFKELDIRVEDLIILTD